MDRRRDRRLPDRDLRRAGRDRDGFSCRSGASSCRRSPPASPAGSPFARPAPPPAPRGRGERRAGPWPPSLRRSTSRPAVRRAPARHARQRSRPPVFSAPTSSARMCVLRSATRPPPPICAACRRRPAPPLELAGLGGSGRHWQMLVHPLGAGGVASSGSPIAPAARAAERMRVDFVANASHELRTPLATILGFIETLQLANGRRTPPPARVFSTTMMGEAKRMQRLIEDLISLSRIEADRHSAPQATVALADLVAEVATLIAASRRRSLAIGSRWISAPICRRSRAIARSSRSCSTI